MSGGWNSGKGMGGAGGKPSVGRWARWGGWVMVLGAGVWMAASGFVAIPADSVGVRLRFGKYLDTLEPGLRFTIPFGVDRVTEVPVQRQLKLEFGFSTDGGSNPDQYSDEPAAEQSMVTGDLSMAMVQWVVQYRIEDAFQYLFHVREPGFTLRDACESVMREVVGDRTVDEVITIGRQEIEQAALARVQQLAKQYGLGISVMQVQLKDVHPPAPVQASFNEVNQAKQEKEQAINQANGEYNRAVPRARGEAMRKVSEAQGYATRRTNEALGDAQRFRVLLAEYRKAPDVTRQRLYHETMKELLPRMDRKILSDQATAPALPLLPLPATGTQPR